MHINTKAMYFLKEKEMRYFAGAFLNLQQSIFDIKTRYTYSFYEDKHYLHIYNLSVKWNSDEKGQWILGRSLNHWDWADSFWNRGLWQPAYREDLLRPHSAGLTGLFRHFSFDKGSAVLFGSFVFMPDFTPPFEIINGKTQSKNPWFTPLPNKWPPTNIIPRYKLHDLELKELLSPSIAGRVSYEDFYLAYAYKPMNKIMVKVPFTIPLYEEPSGTDETGHPIDLNIIPIVLHHHLFSAGMVIDTAGLSHSQQTKNFVNYRLKSSLSYHHPETHETAKSTFYFDPQPTIHTSIKGEIYVKDPIEETALHLAYTHAFNITKPRDNLLTKTLNFEQQIFFKNHLFDFTQAGSAGLTHLLKKDSFSTKIKVRLIYHFITEYFLFSLLTSIKFDNSISFFISGDFMFTDFPFYIEQTTQNIDIYPNKSRLFGGLKYEF